jgi:hypothetical protein
MSERSDPAVVARTTAAEHSAMTRAIQVMERALESPVPGREREWKLRTAAALTVVLDDVSQHVASAEKDGGLLAQVETTIGRSHEVTTAYTHHRRMINEAETLLRDVERAIDDASLQCEDVRRRGASLAGLLRAHHALEADLLLLALEQDIGVGD